MDTVGLVHTPDGDRMSALRTINCDGQKYALAYDVRDSYNVMSIV